MPLTFEDAELAFYVANGAPSTDTVDDAKRFVYKALLGGLPELDDLTTVDLELMVLQDIVGTSPSSACVDDLWYEALKDYDPTLTVQELKYALYTGEIE